MDDEDDLVRPRHRPHRSRRFPGGRPCACPTCRTSRKGRRPSPSPMWPGNSVSGPGYPSSEAESVNGPAQINWTHAAEVVTRGQVGRARGIARVEGGEPFRTSADGNNRPVLPKETRHHD